jgi:hypothetical protein
MIKFSNQLLKYSLTLDKIWSEHVIIYVYSAFDVFSLLMIIEMMT